MKKIVLLFIAITAVVLANGPIVNCTLHPLDLSCHPAPIPGPIGPQGIQGVAGQDGVDGAKGNKGDKGNRGNRGRTGAAGNNGTDGSNGTNGIDGSNGVDGVDGTNGTKGDQGNDGSNGNDGMDGTAGNTGGTGNNGNDGINGKNGKNGSDGVDGKDGRDGNDFNAGEYNAQLHKVEQYQVDSAAGNIAASSIDFGTTLEGVTEVGAGFGMSSGAGLETGYAGAVGIKYGFSDVDAVIGKAWVSGNSNYGVGVGATHRF